MRLSMVFATLALTMVSRTPAEAASITIEFPEAGNVWADLASFTTGTLAPGGYTGKLVGQYSYVLSQNSYPQLENFVATGVSATMNVYNTQYATIDIGVDGASAQYFISGCCGGESFDTGLLALSQPVRLGAGPLQFTYTLDSAIPQSNPIAGNWIQFTEGSLTLYGTVPEPSTWVMTLLGFAGLGFTAHRRTRVKALAA
jgi:hypothetical protein